MKLPFIDWEISVRRETTAWAREGKDHIWEYIFRVEWLSPMEKEHRADIKAGFPLKELTVK